MTQPPFIAIEGCDGSGKSEQARRLAGRIIAGGRSVFLTREPTDGPVGVLIRRYLTRKVELDAAALPTLFAADRADHAARGVGPAIRAGHVVVSDRYSLSNEAYRAAETLGPFYTCAVCGWAGEPGEARPLAGDWVPITCPHCLVAPISLSDPVRARVAWARRLDVDALVPDLTIVLAVPVEAAAARWSGRSGASDVYETTPMQARCSAFYARAAEQHDAPPVVICDGRGDVDEVAALVWAAAAPVLVLERGPKP